MNPDIICPNRPGGRSCRGNSQDAGDVCAWPVDVMTNIIAAVLFTFDTGASGVKYHPLAPESTIAVSCLASLVDICMANRGSHLCAILMLLLFLSGVPCQGRQKNGTQQKYCWEFHVDALSMILEHRWRVNVGPPGGSEGMLHLEGNLPESTVVGLRVVSLANKGVFLGLLALMLEDNWKHDQ